MALRTPKISSEFIKSCKYLSCKAGPIKIRIPKENDPTHLRYKINTTDKPQDLPKLPEYNERVKYDSLQPHSLPKFHEINVSKTNPWTNPSNIESPFPESIKILRTPTLILSDKEKAAQKFAETRSGKISYVSTRNYSTGPFKLLNRLFSSATDESCKKKKKKKCFPETKKVQCKKDKYKKCPGFKLCNCEQSKGSDCKHYYKDPHCKKQEAPYPAYSETCVRELDDDPSECVQCPWYPCGRTVDDLKIPKRDYHTASRSFQIASTSQQFVPFLDITQECDARKKPCPPPPDKCAERNKKIQQHKDKGKKPSNKGKQKAESNWTNAFGMWVSKQTNILDMNQINAYTLKPAGYDLANITKKEDCPPSHKIKKPKVDHSIDESFRPGCCKRHKRRKEYDCHNPPPPYKKRK